MNEPGVGLEGLKEKAKKLIKIGVLFCFMAAVLLSVEVAGYLLTKRTTFLIYIAITIVSFIFLVASLIVNIRTRMKLQKGGVK